MSAPWLKKYFGSKFESLNPVILFEGDKYAVVRLIKTHEGIGYILVKRDSTFETDSKRESLHEGVASGKEVTNMLKHLKSKEAGTNGTGD